MGQFTLEARLAGRKARSLTATRRRNYARAMAARGHTVQRIAFDMGLCERTVQKYLVTK